MASWTSPRDSSRTLPISRVIVRASSSFEAASSPAKRKTDLPPARGRHGSPARLRAPRCLHGRRHVPRVPECVLLEHDANVRRITLAIVAARCRGSPCAVDEDSLHRDSYEGAAPGGHVGGRVGLLRTYCEVHSCQRSAISSACCWYAATSIASIAFQLSGLVARVVSSAGSRSGIAFTFAGS